MDSESQQEDKTEEVSEIITDKNSDKTPEDENKVEDDKPVQIAFKKPSLLIGPRRGKISSIRQLSSTKKSPDDSSSSSVPETPQDSTSNESPESDKTQAEKKNIPLPYKEPSWGGTPPDEYKIEVLKSGVILDTIDLSKQSFYAVGRLPVCDIPLAHPTISRYHAILQYRTKEDDKHGPGYYLYDLESTHGTFWNGCRVKPRTYVQLKCGHIIKFGCSQRRFIIHTPADQQEEESEYSVTELKQMRRMNHLEREQEMKLLKQQAENDERLKKEKEEAEGINWGMGEDAEEESDLAENPFALTNNEELFLDDPKKTLRGWFEREGHDLQYQTEEKGLGQFVCWVDLPIDSSVKSVRAEAIVKGKKKEAVIQCALEACRILDRYGVLRQATHEGRKRKSRNWEEDDFYDSDEDNYLDRTGTIERKREKRMRNAGKLETKVETYSTLMEQLNNVSKEINEINDLLKKNKQSKNSGDDNSGEDALDAFMSNLTSSLLNKSDITKLKLKLQNLHKEEENLKKLVDIARPANLPSLIVPSASKSSDFDANKSEDEKISSPKLEKIVEIEDDDEETVEKSRYGLIKNPEELKKVDDDDCEDKIEIENKKIDKQEGDKIDDDDKIEMTEAQLQKRKKKNQKRIQQRAEKASKDLQKGYEEDKFKEDYSMWLPPENQSGDGKTSLNDKFGY